MPHDLTLLLLLMLLHQLLLMLVLVVLLLLLLLLEECHPVRVRCPGHVALRPTAAAIEAVSTAASHSGGVAAAVAAAAEVEILWQLVWCPYYSCMQLLDPDSTNTDTDNTADWRRQACCSERAVSAGHNGRPRLLPLLLLPLLLLSDSGRGCQR